MVQNLITIQSGNHEKLNIELDPTGIWTLRKNSTPNWRNYCGFPNGSWSEIHGLAGRELCLYDSNKTRCFSLLSWGTQTGRAQLVKPSAYGDWVFTSKPTASEFTFGIGFKAGGHAPFVPFGALGGEQALLMVYTPDQSTVATPYSITSIRLGAGQGGSTGAIFAAIRGFKSSAELNGFMVGGIDYNLALGPNAKCLFKGGVLGKITESADTLKKMSGHLSRTQWENLATVLKDATASSEFLADCDGPSVSIYDLPGIGCGCEISVFVSAGVMLKADMAAFLKAAH